MQTIILLIILVAVLIILLNRSWTMGYMDYINEEQGVEHFYYPNCVQDAFGGMRCYPYEENENARWFYSLIPAQSLALVNSV